MNFTQEITLDISQTSYSKRLYAKQGDYNSRTIIISLTDKGIPISLANYTAKVKCEIVTNGGKKTIAFNSCAIENDKITMQLTREMLSAVSSQCGKLDCEVMIFDTSSKLTSTRFSIDVETSINENDITASPNFSALGEMINQVQELGMAVFIPFDSTFTQGIRTTSITDTYNFASLGVVSLKVTGYFPKGKYILQSPNLFKVYRLITATEVLSIEASAIPYHFELLEDTTELEFGLGMPNNCDVPNTNNDDILNWRYSTAGNAQINLVKDISYRKVDDLIGTEDLDNKAITLEKLSDDLVENLGAVNVRRLC